MHVCTPLAALVALLFTAAGSGFAAAGSGFAAAVAGQALFSPSRLQPVVAPGRTPTTSKVGWVPLVRCLADYIGYVRSPEVWLNFQPVAASRRYAYNLTD